ncbi:nuclear pore complex protein NUP160 isoform X3 [Pistacia vera]|uniref:nuclear pore complex protein NUP160 isoform X3 n=1 Tax=Pistacia vera TaxID=55513 RepID=UPI001263DE22|nr:nuclear pore complex protein NUP160 isoform X3 [Pistacia vera]
MSSKWRWAGTEVPIIGSDSFKFIEISVSSSSSNVQSQSHSNFIAPRADGYASCALVGDPSLHLILRIRESLPNSLDLLPFSFSKPFPILGLRINFPCKLSSFAFLFELAPNVYSLCVLSVSGIVFILKLSANFSDYETYPIFPQEDLLQFNLVNYGDIPITSAAATSGCLVVGRNDGSVAFFQLATHHPTAPGFVQELRDDSGIGRLWGLMSRGRMVGAVQDLVITEVQGKILVYVLHSGGIFRVWDLSSRSRIFSHTITNPSVEGAPFVRLWEVGMEAIDVYSLQCSWGKEPILSLEPSMLNVPMEEGSCIDVKLASDRIWILKDSGLVVHNLFHKDGLVEEAHCYALQEEFVADMLFQSSEHPSDDLLSITHSIVTSPKDYVVLFLSSIFIRRLLHPGVHHNMVLRATLLDYNRHWTDSEFQSLTVDGLKKEIISLVEHEGIAENPLSIFYGWKNFCSRYFHHWCKINEPYGLFVHPSTGAVGLLRKNSVSVFRDLEKIELLIDGSSDEFDDQPTSFGLEFSDDGSEREILFEVLRCITSISQQLGKTASAIFYESLVGTSIISAEEIVPRLLKILETGYGSSVTALNISDLGADVAREKELVDHKNLRKFSVDMLLSLHAVGKKAASWDRVLNVIESYLQFLVPCKIIQNFDSEIVLNINTFILVQATSQIAKVMFESTLDVLLFVSYLVNISGQISMLHDDIARIQLELIPMIQEIVTEWLIILFFGTTPSESPAIEDFSSQLSSLQIDSNIGKRSWNEKLGKCDFTLAFILLLNNQSSLGDPSCILPRCLPNPQEVTGSVRGFTSWIIWGKTGEESSSFLRHSTQLALILLKHGQYDAVQYLLTLVESNSQKEKIFRSIQDTGGDWSLLQHLLGCCLLAQAQCGLPGILKEKKVTEAVRCFFRASSGQGACEALQSLSHKTGLPHLGLNGCLSSAAWKLHYYQWAMQIFEQYNSSEGSCQFALAALEQVDEAVGPEDDCYGGNPQNESATTIKGRLWANVFKFTLDLNLLHDAYCAIISNPDEESKYICLRRFVIVLYERKATKFLCDGQLPFIGLAEKIERELAWKAERSDVLARPNPYKLLYAFEIQRHNWRRAASYIYLYSARLRNGPLPKDHQQILLVLQERLNGLSAAINALHLVHPTYAWIDPLLGQTSFQNGNYPSKKAKKMVKEQLAGNDIQPQRLHSYIDIQKLEKEFVLTSAEYLLSVENVKWTFNGIDKAPLDLVDLLVQKNLYDMAFTVLLNFCKGSRLKSELERVFSAMSLNCCPSKAGSSYSGTPGLLLTSSKDEVVVHGSPDNIPTTKQHKANGQWETLELYLEKYKDFHAGLPVVVAETLLRMDSEIELPLWLVHMFKDGQRDRTKGMTGQESSPASLFRLYVDYGRYTEATNLLLEYIESFASMRPADIINRKRPFAVWFPYTTIERLWCQLEDMTRLGHMVDQCEKLRRILHGALLKHLKLQKVDSDDAIFSASG